MPKTKRTYSYPRQWSYKTILEDGTPLEVNIQTQLYHIGVYIVLTFNGQLQRLSNSPPQVQRMWKHDLKRLGEDNIERSSMIYVTTDDDDFWIEKPIEP